MNKETKKYSNLIFVDCEARGTSPVNGVMTEFGAVHLNTRYTFHGKLYEAHPDPENPAVPVVGDPCSSSLEVARALADWLEALRDDGNMRGRAVMVSDNPAYDFMWIAGMFDEAGMDNPFGHSARRISDFYAGLTGDWNSTQAWKKYRKTPHDHNPVNDAMGNAEAFDHILYLASEGTL
jgi:hypothetical protein